MASDGIRVGVLGSSPLRDLSRALDERAQELEKLIAGLDEVIAGQSAERTRVRLALAQAEEVRAQIMEHRPSAPRHLVTPGTQGAEGHHL